MGWVESGDLKTIFLQGVIPLVVGIGLCFLGCLYLFGVLQLFWSSRHTNQVVAPMAATSEETEEVMTPEAAEKKYGPVACQAKLYGLRHKERRAVLEQIFKDCRTHKDCKEAADIESGSENGDVVNVDIDTRNACVICLRDYEDTDEIMTGCSCNHRFHKQCGLLWLNASKPKDHCPYCRKEMMTGPEMRQAALDALGEDRVSELGQFPSSSSNNNSSSISDIVDTTTTMSNTNSQDTSDRPTPPPAAIEPVPDVENVIDYDL